MILAIALAVAIALQIAARASHLWWLLAACQPVILVVVAYARHTDPIKVGWFGLIAGLATDAAAGRIIGPGAIGGVVAGVVVATVARRFELEGPLFWIIGSLLGASCSEAMTLLIGWSLGAGSDHGWVNVVAVVAMTGATGLLVAAGERGLRAWRSPNRRRRRLLTKL